MDVCAEMDLQTKLPGFDVQRLVNGWRVRGPRQILRIQSEKEMMHHCVSDYSRLLMRDYDFYAPVRLVLEWSRLVSCKAIESAWEKKYRPFVERSIAVALRNYLNEVALFYE